MRWQQEKSANHPVLHVSHVSLVFQDIHQKPIEFCQLCEKAERKINFKGSGIRHSDSATSAILPY